MRVMPTLIAVAVSALVTSAALSETTTPGDDSRLWVPPAEQSALYEMQADAPGDPGTFVLADLALANPDRADTDRADAALFPLPPPTLDGFRPQARPLHMLRYPVAVQSGATLRPQARDIVIPAARWDNRPEGDVWTLAALTALRTNAPGIVDVVPRDIDTWCPAYRQNTDAGRRAFWVGLMSALAWHESRHRPAAVGGGDQWFGLLQIFPPTARGYECRATTGQALTDPIANLSCAARIMAVTVPRDNAIAINDGRWRGIAADWGPMVSTRKRGDMIDWVSGQDYCIRQLNRVPIPPSRPVAQTVVAAAAPAPAPTSAPTAQQQASVTEQATVPLDARISTSGVPAATADRLALGTLEF